VSRLLSGVVRLLGAAQVTDGMDGRDKEVGKGTREAWYLSGCRCLQAGQGTSAEKEKDLLGLFSAFSPRHFLDAQQVGSLLEASNPIIRWHFLIL